MTDLKRLLNSVGMRCFVDYYHDFRSVNDGDITSKALVDRIAKDIGSKLGSNGPATKVNCGCRIIREGLAPQALTLIIESQSAQVSSKTKEQAKNC